MTIGRFVLALALLAVAAPLSSQTAAPPSPSQDMTPISVPQGDGAPVITDGLFTSGEWDDALRVVIREGVTLHVKEFRGVVFIGIRGTPPFGLGPSELLLSSPGGPVQRLHVSAQLGEVVVPQEGAAPPFRYGLTTDWYANELRRDEKKFEQLRSEGKPPIEVMIGSSYPIDGIEFAIRRSKFPGNRWLMRVYASAMVDGKPGMVVYPPGTTEKTVDGWLELKLR